MTARQAGFLNLYATYFEPLGSKDDGKALTLEWVESAGADLKIMAKVFERIAKSDESTFAKKPRLRRIKKLYLELAPSTDLFGVVVAGCTSCLGGKVYIVRGGDSCGSNSPIKRNDVDGVPTPRHFPYMVAVIFPCNCVAGHALNRELARPYSGHYIATMHEECVFPYGQAADQYLIRCRELSPDYVADIDADEVHEPLFVTLGAFEGAARDTGATHDDRRAPDQWESQYD